MTARLRNLDDRFTHKKPFTEEEVKKHDELSKMFVEFAAYLNIELNEGRAKSLMLTELENASSWAHKALGETIANPEEVAPKPKKNVGPKPGPINRKKEK